jgi:hypothetical protein
MRLSRNLSDVAKLAACQVAGSLIIAGGLAWKISWASGGSFLVTSTGMALNLLAMAWIWQRLMRKKSIAWTVAIIVIKYAILLGGIVWLARQPWLVLPAAGLGIAGLLAALPMYVYLGALGPRTAK